MGSDKKKVQKCRKTSEVWNFFYPFPTTGQNYNKLWSKCKWCGAIYLAPGAYGVGNLKQYIKTCLRRDTRDVGQMLISRNQGSISISASNFCAKRFRKLFVALGIKQDLPFQYVE
jgi:hypothetical protein